MLVYGDYFIYIYIYIILNSSRHIYILNMDKIFWYVNYTLIVKKKGRDKLEVLD